MFLGTVPAHACMWNPEEKRAFWRSIPDNYNSGEIVVEVEPVALVTEQHEMFDPDSGGMVEAFTTSCDGLVTIAAYSIRRVIKGDIDADLIVVAPDFHMWDETLNPWKSRILVGKIESGRRFYTFNLIGERDVFEAPVLKPRAPSGPNSPSIAESFFRGAELAFFHVAYFIHTGIAQAFGVRGLRSGGVWIGLVVLGGIVSLIAAIRWNRKSKHS